MDLTRVVKGLGGADNVADVLACATRIRVEVRDPSLIEESYLRSAGVLGVVRAHHVVQIVVGIEAVKEARALQEKVMSKA